MDDKLEMVVEKLAEKKSLITVNNTLKCSIDKLGEETDVIYKEYETLDKKYQREFNINAEKNHECDLLMDTISDLREKIDNYRINENSNINEMREQEAQTKIKHAKSQKNTNLQQNVWQDELRAQKEYAHDLEEENRIAYGDLKEYQAKYKYWTKLQKEKTEVFKEKNKILTQLMQDERPILKANTNKRVFDITKSFCKKLDQRRLTQSIDTTRGVIDLSSTKLFNTTMNTLRVNQHEKSNLAKIHEYSAGKSGKRLSGMNSHNVSHSSSGLYNY